MILKSSHQDISKFVPLSNNSQNRVFRLFLKTSLHSQAAQHLKQGAFSNDNIPVYLHQLPRYVMLCANRNNEFFVGHQILMPQLDCQVWFSLNTEYTYYKVGLQLQSDQRRQLYVSVLIFLVLAFLLFLSSPFTSLQLWWLVSQWGDFS